MFMGGACILGVKSSVFDAVIVGAGYTGLYTAIKLLDRGLKILVVESEPGLTHESYYPGINGERVLISNEYWSLVEDFSFRVIDKDEHGYWVNPLETIILLASETIRRGGVIIVDSLAEPIYKIIGDRIVIVGAVIRYYEDTGGSDREYVATRGIIDTTPQANIVSHLLDKLKLGIVVQGPGPQIPGSGDVIDKTTWVFPGVIVAGLAAINVNGAYAPFPDIGPLLASGEKAAKLYVKGYPQNPNQEFEYPSII